VWKIVANKSLDAAMHSLRKKDLPEATNKDSAREGGINPGSGTLLSLFLKKGGIIE